MRRNTIARLHAREAALPRRTAVEVFIPWHVLGIDERDVANMSPEDRALLDEELRKLASGE